MRTRRAGALVAGLSLLALLVVPRGGVSGQDRGESARPDASELRPPALLVHPEPGKPGVPLRVSSARVSVLVLGGFARTTLDLTFQNDLDRILEGELVLPLPRTATISGFALDLSGKLREASVVEREKARVVFEEIVRRNADPGLVEWVKGNAFRARVYPIPAKGTKRCVLSFEQELADAGSGSARYVLPLGFGASLDRYEEEIRVHGAARVLAADGSVAAEASPKAGESFWTRSTKGDGWKPRDLVLEVPLALAPEVAVEKARVRSPLGAEPELVFVARVPVPAFETKKVAPKRLTVLWDASGSAAARDQKKELVFLESYLAGAGVESVQLVPFSNAVWTKGGGSFEVKEGKCPSLVAAISALRPDGGTSLGCLALERWDAATDHYLLFSDGLSNFGEGELSPGEKAVSCVASAPTNDFAALERIARRGALVNLGELTPEEAVRRALVEPRVLLGTSGAVSVLPGGAARLEGSVVSVVGRIREKTKLVLRFGAGAAEVATREVELDPSATTDTGLVERIWASRKVESLLARGKDADEGEVTKLAKAHGLVTSLTSLLVLDSIDDYVKYKIKPPAELLDEWEKRIEAERGTESRSRDERLESVRARWKARVEWWERKFDLPPAGTKFPPKDQARGEGGVGGPAPSGAMPPPSPDAAPREMDRPAEGGAPRAANGPRRARALRPADGADRDAFDESAKKSDEGSEGGRGSESKSIALKPWDPNTPYLAAYKKVTDPDALYACYLEQRASYASSTAFFLDSADFFYGVKLPELALRILSNLAELQLESAPLLRILGYRLEQAGELGLAIPIFRLVQKIKPEEPQSFRDLGLALAEAKDWAGSVANLEKVVLGTWDGRFPDVELVVLGELNQVLARARAAGAQGSLTTLPSDLIRNLDVDLRIILTWDADNTDMDLWVVVPTGEKAFYSNTLTTIGGAFGRDFTGGYGPEEYLIRRAMKGTYKIQINYYGNRQQVIAGDTTVQITLVKNWGRPDEARQAVTRRLKDKQEVLDIAEITVGQ